LALADGDDALSRDDTAALRDCLERLQHFVPGAHLLSEEVLAFLRRLAKQRGLSAEINRVLSALRPTRTGAQAAAMLRRRRSRR